MSANLMSVIQVDGLTKSYGTVHTVDDMGFDAERGELFGFLRR